MKPKTKKLLSNICFFLMIASLVGILTAIRYSYATNPDPIVMICVAVCAVSLILLFVLRRNKSE